MSSCHCGSILDFINVFLSPGQRSWRPCQSFLLLLRAHLPPPQAPCGYVVSFQSCRPGWDSSTHNLSGSRGKCLSITWTPPSLFPPLPPPSLPCPCHSVKAGGWTLARHQNPGLVGKRAGRAAAEAIIHRLLGKMGWGPPLFSITRDALVCFGDPQESPQKHWAPETAAA